jgi:enoyl-CoA hydratase/carnithine racemase
LHLAPEDLVAASRDQPPWSPTDPTVVVVEADDAWPSAGPPTALTAAVVVGVTDDDGHPADHAGSAWCDVVLPRGDTRVDAIVARVEQTPLASTALVQVLRGSEERSMDDGLLVESAVYSTLQAGPEFRAWRESRPTKERVEPDAAPVLLERADDHLTITLNRPHVRNALDTAMRNALVDAFQLVRLDESITAVTLRGAGSSYSSGGDLDEFGSFTSPASAHLVRLMASVGRAIADVSARVRVELQGACMGSGIELPAFAAVLEADPTARIGLPELRLGLIPGAGGTWSLPQRIGRHRTALLALTCDTIDAADAARWGLASATPATNAR